MKNLILILIFGSIFNYSFSQVTIDAIIAVVGKEIILQSDLDKAVLERTTLNRDIDDMDAVKCAVLQELIYAKLMIHQADIDSVIITNEEVDNQIDARIQAWLQSVGGDTKIIEQHFGKTIE